MNKREIEEILLKIGVPAGIKGFRYITDALMLLDTPEWKEAKFIALYEKVGEMNGTTGSRVERAIRHAFETTRAHVGETDDVVRYIGRKKTVSSDALKMLYTRLKNESEVVFPRTSGGNHNEIALRRIIREEVRELLKGILLGGDTL